MQALEETIVSSDGATHLHLYTWLPSGGNGESPRGIFQICHGMAEHAGRYAPFAEVLTSAGFAVYAHDHRGHGLSAPSPADLGHFGDDDGWSKVLADIHHVNALARTKHPGLKAVVFGHSMGSFLVQHLLFAHGRDVDACILSGSNGSAGLLALAGRIAVAIEQKRLGKRGKSPVLHAMSFGGFNKPFAPNRSPHDWLSRDTAMVDAYDASPLCGFVCSTETWRQLLLGLSQIDRPENQGRIRKDLPVFIVAGSEDPVSKQTQGLTALMKAYQKAGLTRVEHRFYPGMRHETLNEVGRDQVMRDVSDWALSALRVSPQ